MTEPTNVLWAFRLAGALTTTGVLFGARESRLGIKRPRSPRFDKKLWTLGIEDPEALNWALKWGRLKPGEIQRSADSSDVVVLMVNPDDIVSYAAAVEFLGIVSHAGVATILVTAATESDSDKSANRRNKKRGIGLSIGQPDWQKQCFRTTVKNAVSAMTKRKARDQYAACLLESTTSDPSSDLVRFCFPVATGWLGMIGVDLTDLRTVIGMGRTGWWQSRSGKGPKRAEDAVNGAIGGLKRMGANLRDASGCFVTVTSDRTVRMQEMRKIMSTVRRELDDDSIIVQGHVFRESIGALLHVDLMVFVGDEVN